MEDDDTQEVRIAPKSDTDPCIVAAAAFAHSDTEEIEDTDREILAQDPPVTTPQMFEDTGVVILDQPPELATTDRLVVTFRQPSLVTFKAPAPKSRAGTTNEWPPTPREPADVRERALRNAAVYTVVARPETKN